MVRPVDALVTGFVKSGELLNRSLAPLRRLRQQGIIRAIHCVTWDSAELDPFVALLEVMDDVKLTRVKQPEAQGGPNQRGVVYQVENLKAALALVADEPLILKWRPDFVAQYDFLCSKIVYFDTYAAVPPRTCFGVTMPAPVFGNKIWLPWADCNNPFFFEDAVFLGAKADVAKLAVPPNAADHEILGDPLCGTYAHVMRFAKPFLGHYPLLRNYLKFFRPFRTDLEYRKQLIAFLTNNGFFWHVLIAHAWILHSQFHVDAGAQDDLVFFSNAANPQADWSDFSSLKSAFPYDSIEGWRASTHAGKLLPGPSRPFGRLMDDKWQRAIFTQELPDLPRQTLTALMANVAGSGDGRLAKIEAEFYQALAQLSAQHPPAALAG